MTTRDDEWLRERRKGPPQTRDEWMRERRKGIGGSDAPAVAGVSQWKSPYELWAEKLGRIPPEPENEAMEFGRKLERIVLDTLAERTGRTVVPWEQTKIVTHPQIDFVRCTPDAFQIDEQRGRGIVQAKTCSAYAAHEWADAPPLPYQVQIQHEMACTESDWGTLCVLKGGQSFAYYDLERNDDFVAALLKREAEFWECVLSETPPEIDGSDSCTKALKLLHPMDDGTSVALPPEAELWDEELQACKQRLSYLQSQEKLLKNKITAAIGDATFGVLPSGEEYSLKTQTRAAYEVAEATFRVLRRRKGNK